MLHLKPSRNSNPETLKFLEQNPSLYQSLFDDPSPDEGEQNFDRVVTFIEPALAPPKRNGISPYYIQAVTAGRTSFLTTNLHNVDEVQLTEIATSWLIGRSPNCAIAVPNPSVSRCHAVIGRSTSGGFYITDVGSSNGTFVNRRRLAPLERRPLRDGDLLGLSTVQVELFIVGCEELPSLQDSTHC
jgi:pSer/pThr/pTyr-binding forkhead associated (FHA) protein